MNNLHIYNSKDSRYKTPYGAVAAGTTVHFTLRPPEGDHYTHGDLIAVFENDNNNRYSIPLVKTGVEDGCTIFTASLDTGDYIGLVWYSFVLKGDWFEHLDLGGYQLTVFDGNENVPTWFGEGMSYQIFPDRFNRTKIPDPTGLVGGRTVHDNWYEEPDYLPDEKGEIRNRDFFGGDLQGVIEKLDYLEHLGVETLYFCPIFEACENHRYGTSDYSRVDPMLGCNEDFTHLCDEAHKRGMKVMLDGVFNHTGFVSRYFNGDGFYTDSVGACQSEDSPYRHWFNFVQWPDSYESWWGIYSLPAVNEYNEDYRNFIFGDENSVIRRWLRAGADGWRLDVADEVPDDFVAGIHQAARAENPNAVVIGEVWEDGTTKIAYDVRRRHILGGHCDGLMNYPLRTAILDFMMGGEAQDFVSAMETLRENYPHFAFYSAMNSLGTHDTLRVLTLFGAGGGCKGESRDFRAEFRLKPARLEIARQQVMAAELLLFAFPGSPTVYYGDEIGMEGFEDPFNRRTYPWGQEDTVLLDWFVQLGQMRKSCPALRCGDLRYLESHGALLAFQRSCEEETLVVAVNRGEEAESIQLDSGIALETVMGFGTVDENNLLTIPPRSGFVGKVK